MVREHTVKNPGSRDGRLSRRELLGVAAALVALPVAESALGQQKPPASQPTSAPSVPSFQRVDPPWWLRFNAPRSRVVDIASADVLHASVVDEIVLAGMLEQALRALTGERSVETAWRAVLGSPKRIVLKFNSVGANVIKTNDVLARQLVQSLLNAGYEREQLALAELPTYLTDELGVAPVVEGWGELIDVGERREALATYLYDADAVINVPLLKTHQIAGMSCSLKNLSHALIRHPARYHANQCSPYVGQIVGNTAISSRLRLNVVNALRVVTAHGPDAREEDLSGYGGLILGFDPVAVDNVGLGILAMQRRDRHLSTDLWVPYLTSAAAMGLGRWRPADIDRITLGVGA